MRHHIENNRVIIPQQTNDTCAKTIQTQHPKKVKVANQNIKRRHPHEKNAKVT
jgi:hypothetical protein